MLTLQAFAVERLTHVIAAGGLDTALAVSGILATVISLCGIVLGVGSNNRQRRREYQTELDAAYTRGRDSVMDDLTEARRDRDYWRDLALGRRPNAGK